MRRKRFPLKALRFVLRAFESARESEMRRILREHKKQIFMTMGTRHKKKILLFLFKCLAERMSNEARQRDERENLVEMCLKLN